MFCVSSEHDYLLSSRITWLYIPSSRPCSTLTSGETGPGLTTGGSPNLGYVKLPNLEFLTQPERALCFSSHCASYSAKSLSKLLLFLLLVIDRKPWVCRAAESEDTTEESSSLYMRLGCLGDFRQVW